MSSGRGWEDEMKVSALLLVLVSAQALGQPTLEDLQKQQTIDDARHQNEQAVETLNKVETLMRKMLADRHMACQRSFGNERFCACLDESLPIAWTFQDYIAITTMSKEQNGYAAMKPNDRKAYDMVGPVRDKCVGAKH
jgi:hypothetical protein